MHLSCNKLKIHWLVAVFVMVMSCLRKHRQLACALQLVA